MSNNVEIKVRAKTVDLAVEAAMLELGVDSREELSVQIINEPVKGFLGIGGEDAVVLVRKAKVSQGRKDRKQSGKQQKQRSGKGKSGNGGRDASGSGKNRSGNQKRADQKPKNQKNRQQKKEKKKVSDDRPVLSGEEQAKIAQEFLEGLVDAYGLEGSVKAEVDDEDVIIANVEGEQTEALVGVRGSVRSAIHELTRTVIQRYTQDTNRLRLDIAGYAERRRQALAIYAEQLIEQLREEGGEIMLEPMSPADRKVIHDVAAENEGIGSYSEGESPRRYVVLTIDSDSASSSGEEE